MMGRGTNQPELNARFGMEMEWSVDAGGMSHDVPGMR